MDDYADLKKMLKENKKNRNQPEKLSSLLSTLTASKVTNKLYNSNQDPSLQSSSFNCDFLNTQKTSIAQTLPDHEFVGPEKKHLLSIKEKLRHLQLEKRKGKATQLSQVNNFYMTSISKLSFDVLKIKSSKLTGDLHDHERNILGEFSHVSDQNLKSEYPNLHFISMKEASAEKNPKAARLFLDKVIARRKLGFVQQIKNTQVLALSQQQNNNELESMHIKLSFTILMRHMDEYLNDFKKNCRKIEYYKFKTRNEIKRHTFYNSGLETKIKVKEAEKLRLKEMLSSLSEYKKFIYAVKFRSKCFLEEDRNGTIFVPKDSSSSLKSRIYSISPKSTIKSVSTTRKQSNLNQANHNVSKANNMLLSKLNSEIGSDPKKFSNLKYGFKTDRNQKASVNNKKLTIEMDYTEQPLRPGKSQLSQTFIRKNQPKFLKKFTDSYDVFLSPDSMFNEINKLEEDCFNLMKKRTLNSLLLNSLKVDIEKRNEQNKIEGNLIGDQYYSFNYLTSLRDGLSKKNIELKEQLAYINQRYSQHNYEENATSISHLPFLGIDHSLMAIIKKTKIGQGEYSSLVKQQFITILKTISQIVKQSLENSKKKEAENFVLHHLSDLRLQVFNKGILNKMLLTNAEPILDLFFQELNSFQTSNHKAYSQALKIIENTKKLKNVEVEKKIQAIKLRNLKDKIFNKKLPIVLKSQFNGRFNPYKYKRRSQLRRRFIRKSSSESLQHLHCEMKTNSSQASFKARKRAADREAEEFRRLINY